MLCNLYHSFHIWLQCISAPFVNSGRIFSKLFCEPLVCSFFLSQNNL